MIKLILSITALLACALAEAQVVVPSNFDAVYIPQGFDSNDNVQIVGEGAFSSSCYRPATVRFKVDEQRKVIQLSPAAYVYYGFCLQVIVPFDQTIDVGPLEPGLYRVVQNGHTLGKLPVRGATVASADEFTYAPISQAFIVKSQGRYQWGITGDMTNSCMYLEDVKISVEDNVIVLQPIVRMQKTGMCRDVITPFSKFGDLKSLRSGRYLLHVRSLNGNAINSLVNIR